ncbi:MAG TPA: LysR substrate-binding domain-containing protein [Puia sp.]|nr:LysR substrate-binding domain-containing protein [Puia sp.]
MNIQQLEYIVAVDNHRHFAKASEKSFVTQPTLSAMIQKLEEEFSVRIFDRSKQPVIPTPKGQEIISRARRVLAEVNELRNFVNDLKGGTSGELRLGIIPTLAPYLLPLFLRSFREKNPDLKLFIKEMVTDEIIASLKSGELDMGLLSTPLNESGISEHKLFDEELYAYASACLKLPAKRLLQPEEIDISHLWLLEEGHCLRNQVFNLCELRKTDSANETLHYEAGSIETLINLVDSHHGVTIIPKLASFGLDSSQMKKLCQFADPKPVREISLVVAKDFSRKKLIEQLMNEIQLSVPIESTGHNKNIVGIKSRNPEHSLN